MEHTLFTTKEGILVYIYVYKGIYTKNDLLIDILFFYYVSIITLVKVSSTKNCRYLYIDCKFIYIKHNLCTKSTIRGGKVQAR